MTPQKFAYRLVFYQENDSEKFLSANSEANPVSCFNRNNSSTSIPIFFIIQASDIPDCTSSETILLINSIE